MSVLILITCLLNNLWRCKEKLIVNHSSSPDSCPVHSLWIPLPLRSEKSRSQNPRRCWPWRKRWWWCRWCSRWPPMVDCSEKDLRLHQWSRLSSPRYCRIRKWEALLDGNGIEITVPFNNMRTLKFRQSNVQRLLPGSNYGGALFRYLNCAQRFDYRAFGSSWKCACSLTLAIPRRSWLWRASTWRYQHCQS